MEWKNVCRDNFLNYSLRELELRTLKQYLLSVLIYSYATFLLKSFTQKSPIFHFKMLSPTRNLYFRNHLMEVELNLLRTWGKEVFSTLTSNSLKKEKMIKFKTPSLTTEIMLYIILQIFLLRTKSIANHCLLLLFTLSLSIQRELSLFLL